MQNGEEEKRNEGDAREDKEEGNKEKVTEEEDRKKDKGDKRRRINGDQRGVGKETKEGRREEVKDTGEKGE